MIFGRDIDIVKNHRQSRSLKLCNCSSDRNFSLVGVTNRQPIYQIKLNKQNKEKDRENRDKKVAIRLSKKIRLRMELKTWEGLILYV